MSRTKSLFLIAGAALGLGASAMAQQTNLDQSRSYSNELLADAAGRTSALAETPRTFTVDVHGFLQFRYIWTQLDDDDLDDDTATGFQTARTVLTVSGNIINENWGYFIRFNFNEEGSATLEDAYGTYKMDNGWNLMWGQFKLPILREELVDDKFQLTADRSPTNNVFSQGRSQGIQIGYEGEQFRFMGAFSDGIRTANTDYTSGAEADFGFTGRVEFKWAGDWKQARDMTSFQGADYFGMVGGALHYQSGGDTVGTADNSVWMATIDATMEGSGWNVYAAGIISSVDPDIGSDFQDMGFLIQGGFFVAPQWELFGRFDMTLPDDDRGTGGDEDFSTITIGVNHYVVPESHVAKATIELIYFMDTPSESIVPTSTLTPLLPSDSDSQWSILGQFQLVF